VIVLANNGRDDVTVWGDILTEVAHRKGIAGTVIDGINRDVALCLELNYPIYSRESWMRTGKIACRSRRHRSPSRSDGREWNTTAAGGAVVFHSGRTKRWRQRRATAVGCTGSGSTVAPDR
jgi:hypothetical protein